MAIRTLTIGTHEDSIQYDDADGFAMALDNAASQEVLVSDGSGQFTSSPISAGGAAPIGASYVVIALDGDLTSERRLQGTVNEIALTDGGAGGDVTLGFPSSVIINTLTVSNDFIVDTDTLFVDTTSKEVGIGTTTPAAELHILLSAAGGLVESRVENSDSGTGNNRTQLDLKVGAASTGFNAVRYNGGGNFWSVGVDYGDGDKFKITTTSTPTGAEAMEITRGKNTTFFGDLNVGLTPALFIDISLDRGAIGPTAPLATWHVDQSSLTAAVPVIFLDQADLSEEMIEFNTTIGIGNPIEAIGAKVFTETHFIRITIPGGLSRVIPCGTIA